MCIIYSVGCMPCASIAQSVEHFTRNEGVEGSSPFSSLTEKHRKSSKIKGFWCFLRFETAIFLMHKNRLKQCEKV